MPMAMSSPLRAYYAANVADQIYCNPKGGVEWKGLTSIMGFLKGGLDKLEIQPEIFYAGKFKSATEPLRAEKMSDANRHATDGDPGRNIQSYTCSNGYKSRTGQCVYSGVA